jgi:hypothetical protein
LSTSKKYLSPILIAGSVRSRSFGSGSRSRKSFGLILVAAVIRFTSKAVTQTANEVQHLPQRMQGDKNFTSLSWHVKLIIINITFA